MKKNKNNIPFPGAFVSRRSEPQSCFHTATRLITDSLRLATHSPGEAQEALFLKVRRRKVVTNYMGHAPSGHNFLWTVSTLQGTELSQCVCTPSDVIMLVTTRFCAFNVSGRSSAACLSPTIRTVTQSDLWSRRQCPDSDGTQIQSHCSGTANRISLVR
jgi:hypothetical protein